MERLDDRIAIVTGAAPGVGAAIAGRMIEVGARVVLGDIREDAGVEVASKLGAAATYLPLDVTREEDWRRAVDATLSEHGRIDILVNNAAQLHLGTIENTSSDQARRILDVNPLGPFLGIRAVIPTMRAQGGGAIVNIGSLDGLLGMNGVAAYSASKWGLRGPAKSAALELGRAGIRVNTVCPAGGNPEMYGPWMQQLIGMLDQANAYTEDRGIPVEVPI